MWHQNHGRFSARSRYPCSGPGSELGETQSDPYKCGGTTNFMAINLVICTLNMLPSHLWPGTLMWGPVLLHLCVCGCRTVGFIDAGEWMVLLIKAAPSGL